MLAITEGGWSGTAEWIQSLYHVPARCQAFPRPSVIIPHSVLAETCEAVCFTTGGGWEERGERNPGSWGTEPFPQTHHAGKHQASARSQHAYSSPPPTIMSPTASRPNLHFHTTASSRGQPLVAPEASTPLLVCPERQVLTAQPLGPSLAFQLWPTAHRAGHRVYWSSCLQNMPTPLSPPSICAFLLPGILLNCCSAFYLNKILSHHEKTAKGLENNRKDEMNSVCYWAVLKMVSLQEKTDKETECLLHRGLNSDSLFIWLIRLEQWI